ncbi:MAG TPA: M23 family metallopeptidase [Spirochaetota bacterium]|nr:M23 family metallopeptidase [Spirochaetota bacterium]
MKKIIIAASALLLFSLSGGIVFSASAKNDDKDEDLIENAIIVDGLTLTADKDMENDDKDGTVIYDDSFDDGLRIAEKVSKHRKSGDHIKSNDFVDTLRTKDSKWHMTKYEIRKGDTLFGIARKFNTSHKLIIRANEIKGADSLRTGNIIMVPNRMGVQYRIKRGDTLTAISKKFKIDSDIISKSNGISKGRLMAGLSIFIPDAVELKTIPAERIAKREAIRKNTVRDNDRFEGDNDVARDKAEAGDTKLSYTNKRSFVFSWPLRGRITSGFGTRADPFSGRRSFHNGIDISAEVGTSVKACADGEVIFSGWKEGYGKLVVIKHANGYVSVYGHNSELKKDVGEAVSKGDIISLSGMTGAVTGAHLHFEIQKYQTPLNPLRMLK